MNASTKAILKIIWKEFGLNIIQNIIIFSILIWIFSTKIIPRNVLNDNNWIVLLLIEMAALVISISPTEICKKYFGNKPESIPHKLFTYPITNKKIYHIFLTSSFIGTFLTVIVLIIFSNRIFDLHNSLFWGIIISSIFPPFMTSFSWFRIPTLTLLISTFFISIFVIVSLPYSVSNNIIGLISKYKLFLLIGYFGINYYLALTGLSIHRSKIKIKDWLILRKVIKIILLPLFLRRYLRIRKPYKSSFSAQFWVEWKENSSLLVYFVIFIFPILIIMNISGVLLILILIASYIKEKSETNDNKVQYSYRLPITNRKLAISQYFAILFDKILCTFLFLISLTIFTKGEIWLWLFTGINTFGKNFDFELIAFILFIYWIMPGLFVTWKFYKRWIFDYIFLIIYIAFVILYFAYPWIPYIKFIKQNHILWILCLLITFDLFKDISLGILKKLNPNNFYVLIILIYLSLLIVSFILIAYISPWVLKIPAAAPIQIAFITAILSNLIILPELFKQSRHQ